MKFTRTPPTKPGYYWWTDFGEHTPTIVEVVRENGMLYAQNEERSFRVKKVDLAKVIKEAKKYEMEPVDGHYYGDYMWCYIPVPTLDGKKIEPDCY